MTSIDGEEEEKYERYGENDGAERSVDEDESYEEEDGAEGPGDADEREKGKFRPSLIESEAD